MNTSSKYTFLISQDFPQRRVNKNTLTNEIHNSNISTKLQSLDIIGNVVNIWFVNILTVNDNDILDIIISNHQGIEKLQKVKIEEEDILTGKHFATQSRALTTDSGTSIELSLSLPIPITVLCFKFSSKISQQNDTLDIYIGPNTVGAITANVIPPATWSSQNYTQGQIVTYNHPIFGIRPYTCIVDTISNETPLNSNYWQTGFAVPMTSGTLAIFNLGFHVSITDQVNTAELGRVIFKDDNSLYTEYYPSNTYLASSPTYIKMNIKSLNSYCLGYKTDHSIGETRIGGTHIPKDTVTTFKYTNNSTQTETLHLAMEYLY